MEPSECKPGVAVYHTEQDFHGIITGRTKISSFCGETLYEVIRTNGDDYWAFPHLMTIHKRGSYGSIRM
jgi:hypothetical protein